jgi:Ca-activated chloride channel family protein
MMEWLRHMSFASPWYLPLCALLPLYIYDRYRHQRHTQTALPVSIINQQINLKSWRTVLASILPWLAIMGILFAILALARPQVVLVEERIKAEGIDIFLAMDLSSSMLSKDFTPDRLSVSKQVAIDFVEKRPYDRLGLASFAGEAYTQSPLTSDHKIIQKLLSELRCGYLSDGTAIGMGLATAINRIKDSEAETKIIILLTDGVNNAGYIDPQTATDIAVEYGIKVYTIGVGSMGMALSPVGRTRNGQYQFARTRVEIDDKLLLEIAQKTGGEYYRAINADELQAIYAKIDELEKTEMEVTIIRREKEYFRHVLSISFVLFSVYILLKYQVLRLWPD